METWMEDDGTGRLLNNDTYLSAIQKASISVYNLGFVPLDHTATFRRRDGLVTPVIPRGDQCSMIDRVDHTIHCYIRKQQKHSKTSRLRVSIDPTKDNEIMEALAQFQIPEVVEEDDQSSKKKKKFRRPSSAPATNKTERKVNPKNGLFSARPTQRMREMEEEKEKEKAQQQALEKHARRVGSRFTLMEEGVELVYDENGKKMPAFALEQQKEQEKAQREREIKLEEEQHRKQQQDAREKRRRSNSTNSVNQLWVKSSSHVERLRQQAITNRKEVPYWEPSSLPASTLALATESNALPAVLIFNKFPKNGEYEQLLKEMVPGDILITIEHCDHCYLHDDHTHHQRGQYRDMAHIVQEALRETAKRYALRYFSLTRGIDDVDALASSKSHARQLYEAQKNTGDTGAMLDDVKLEDSAVAQTLGKLRRALSVTSFNIAAKDFQAIRNEAKVQVLASHNRNRVGAFEVQVTLCVQAGSHHKPAATSPHPDAAHPDLQHLPRQFIQHVLYSKLYHGAWPSVAKLRERLEVLLDLHNITRLVRGSTVRHANPTAGNGRSNPALQGLLSRLQHHHEENAEKVAAQRDKLRRRSTVLPADLQKMVLTVPSSPDRPATAPSKPKLEERLPPAFDQRFGLPPSRVSAAMGGGSGSGSGVGSGTGSGAHTPGPLRHSPVPFSDHPHQQPQQQQRAVLQLQIDDNNHHPAAAGTAAPVNLDPDEALFALDTEILKTTKAAAAASGTGHGTQRMWTDDPHSPTPAQPQTQSQSQSQSQTQGPSVTIASGSPTVVPPATAARRHSTSSASRTSSPQSVSSGQGQGQGQGFGSGSKAKSGTSPKAALSPMSQKRASVSGAMMRAPRNTVVQTQPQQQQPQQQQSSLRKDAVLGRQQSLGHWAPAGSTSTPVEGDAPPAHNNAQTAAAAVSAESALADGDAKVFGTVAGEDVSLSQRFKQHESNLLLQALQSIQDLIHLDDKPKGKYQAGEGGEDDLFDSSGELHRMDSMTFEDPFWKQLMASESGVLRISVNLGKNGHHPDDEEHVGEGGGVQVDVQHIPMSRASTNGSGEGKKSDEATPDSVSLASPIKKAIDKSKGLG